MMVRWADGFAVEVTVRRFPWWLVWWPSRNVTFGRTIFEGGPVGMNAPTMRHESQHVRQYIELGWWWVWTHPTAREFDATAVQGADWPRWEGV